MGKHVLAEAFQEAIAAVGTTNTITKSAMPPALVTDAESKLGIMGDQPKFKYIRRG